MTTDTNKIASKTPAREKPADKIKVLQVNPETFDLICRSLYNQTCELTAMARDIAELRLAFSQVAQTLAAMGIDLRAVASAHRGPGFRQEQAPTVDIDMLAKRLPPIDDDDVLPKVLRPKSA